MRTALLIVAVIASVAGLLAYLVALANFNSGAGELWSDVGNAIWLGAMLLLLFRLSMTEKRSPPSSE